MFYIATSTRTRTISKATRGFDNVCSSIMELEPHGIPADHTAFGSTGSSPGNSSGAVRTPRSLVEHQLIAIRYTTQIDLHFIDCFEQVIINAITYNRIEFVVRVGTNEFAHPRCSSNE